jgi:S-adenosylmethionine synthetase
MDLEGIQMKKIISSESVNIGHPDKTCDTIADAFLDAALETDPNAQMAVECAIKDDLLMIYGEATTTAQIDYAAVASQVLREVGYDKPFRIIQQISKQSPDINAAVVREELCANDQGMAYGYACNETPEYMPLPITIAHKLMRKYEEFRKTRKDFFSDAKSQVSVVYDKDGKPEAIATVLVSVSHCADLKTDALEFCIQKWVIGPVLGEYNHLDTVNTKIIINPSGRFTIWGSHGDSGCVGRKIIVDTYGGVGRVGGGCFSSKNATKIDRSAAYYARYVAKNIVARGYADKCEIQAAYGIGLAEPISLDIETFGTAKVPQEKIEKYVSDNFCFRPSSIIRELDLLKPIYKQTACYGHFGREEFSWEKIKP